MKYSTSKELTIPLKFGISTFVRLHFLITMEKRGIAYFTHHIHIINFQTSKFFNMDRENDNVLKSSLQVTKT